MSKEYKIRWKQDDEKRLAKSVKNFNAKLTRLAKKDPSIANYLPERITVKEMKELIKTRADLNREIKALERFTKTNRGKTKSGKAKAQPHDIILVPGNNYNVHATRWQVAEMKRSKALIDKKRQERHDMLYSAEQTDRGKPLGYTAGQLGMGRADANALKPITLFNKSMNQRDFFKKFKTIRKERQSNYWTDQELQMKENYIKGLTENYRFEDMEEVINHIKKMPFDQFFETYKHDQTIFEYASGSPTESTYQGYVNKVYATWLPSRGDRQFDKDENGILSTEYDDRQIRKVDDVEQRSNTNKLNPVETSRNTQQQPQRSAWNNPTPQNRPSTQNRPYKSKKENKPN